MLRAVGLAWGILGVLGLGLALALAEAVGEATDARVRLLWIDGFLTERPSLYGLSFSPAQQPGLRVHASVVRLTFDRPRATHPEAALRVVRAEGLELWIDRDAVAVAAAPPHAAQEPSPIAPNPAPRPSQRAWPDRVEIEGATLGLRGGQGGAAYRLALTDLRLTAIRDDEAPSEVALRFQGRFAGGRIGGEGRIELDGGPRLSDLQVRLERGELAQLAADLKAPPGALYGQIDAFASARSDAVSASLSAAGWIEARRGRAWELPPFAAVLAAMQLSADGDDGFRSARARWHYEDGRIEARELILLATPLSLFGQGTIDLERGRIDAAFVPRFGERELENLPLVGELSQLAFEVVKGALLELGVRGSLADPSVEVRPLPMITNPIRAFIDLVGGE